MMALMEDEPQKAYTIVPENNTQIFCEASLIQVLSKKHFLICLGRGMLKERGHGNFLSVVKVATCQSVPQKEARKLPLSHRGQWFSPPINEL